VPQVAILPRPVRPTKPKTGKKPVSFVQYFRQDFNANFSAIRRGCTKVKFDLTNQACLTNLNRFRNYLKTVTLSEAKVLAGRNKRFFAAIRMTTCVFSIRKSIIKFEQSFELEWSNRRCYQVRKPVRVERGRGAAIID
jgi:hypothetical protein